jgi:biotin carboxylase
MILGARLAQLPAIHAALARGCRVVAVDPTPDAPGLALAHARYSRDLADVPALISIARRHAIDGVFTLAADYPMRALGCIRAALGLPGPSEAAIARATNKRLMRDALTAAGVPCPRYWHAASLGQALQAFDAAHADVVVKPTLSHGGRGVTRVAAGSEAETLRRAFERALRETRADGVVIEDFVDGPECSVESITVGRRTQVIAVTEKLTSGPPYFVEMGHQQPARYSAKVRVELEDVAKRCQQALEVEDAAGHTEIRLSAQGPVVMETAARLGGGFITSHLVPASTGVDMVGACLAVALGEAPDFAPARAPAPCAIRFIAAAPGVVDAVEGLEELRAHAEVTDVQLYVRPGDRVGALVDATARCGHVICAGRSTAEAIEHAEAAAARVRIHTLSAGSPSVAP